MKKDKEKLDQLLKYYERATELLDIVVGMQRTIAENQVTILSLLRKINHGGFEKIANELAVRHITKFRPDKCQFCGIMIEGAYEYMRSQANATICTSCDDRKSATKDPNLPVFKKKEEDRRLVYKARGQV